jgi:hypothetical protein
MITLEHSSSEEVVPATRAASTGPRVVGRVLLVVLAAVAWWFLYRNLEALASFLTYSVFSMAAGSHLAAAVEFFLFETPKVLMLLTVVVFGVGIVRSFFTPERTRRLLAGRRETAGNVLASLLGVVTPFCSCSAVPLFIGFVTTGVPLGVTFSFLISAPMVNEVALVLLFGLFGWKVAALYMGTGLVIAMVAGWVIGRLHLERWVEGWVYQTTTESASGGAEDALAWSDRVRFGREAVKDIVGKVWPYILAGIAVGAGIHGYVLYRSSEAGLPHAQWPLVADDVVDMDEATPNAQWVDTTDDESPTGTWFYQVAPYNHACPPDSAEGPW